MTQKVEFTYKVPIRLKPGMKYEKMTENQKSLLRHEAELILASGAVDPSIEVIEDQKKLMKEDPNDTF